jgi:hypothetical protein
MFGVCRIISLPGGVILSISSPKVTTFFIFVYLDKIVFCGQNLPTVLHLHYKEFRAASQGGGGFFFTNKKNALFFVFARD